MKPVQQWILTKQQDACLNANLHNQSFLSKTWSQFSLTKFFDHVNLHQKLCQRNLIDSWWNRNPSYFSKNFDGL
jgi:hypothetical protein